MMKKVSQKFGLALMLWVYATLALSGGLESITKENVNDFDAKGWTPLMRVINEYYSPNNNDGPERLKTIEDLLILGADPNLRSKNDRNDTAYTLCDRPPISAAIMKLLVRYGADVNQYNGWGRSNLPRVSKDKSLLKTILAAGLNPNGKLSQSLNLTYLQSLVIDENYDAIKLFLEFGADPDKSDQLFNSPLFRAFQLTDLRIARLLIEKGASIHGNQPISRALAMENNKEIIEILLAHGADVNEIDEKGNSSLHIAYLWLKKGKNMHPLISYLLNKGANPNLENTDGKRPHEM